MFNITFSGFSQTKIWMPDAVEFWIYYHKKQYDAFKDFNINEDSIGKKNDDYLLYMKQLSKVDDNLFSQYQNNEVPLSNFMFNATHIIDLSTNLYNIIGNTSQIIKDYPELNDIFNEAKRKTDRRIEDFVSDILKSIVGNNKKNLRDNDERDKLCNNIISELEKMVGNWNRIFIKMQAAAWNARINSENK